MSNPYYRLEELDQQLGVTRAQLEEVNSRLNTLGAPPYLESTANVSRDSEVLSREVTALSPEEQRQKAERFPDKLELYTSLSAEKGRLEKEVGGLETERLHVNEEVTRIDQLRAELSHVEGQITGAKAENIEALKAYDDKITGLKDDTDRRYTIHDLNELKSLDAKIDQCQERQIELEGRRTEIETRIVDSFLGASAPGAPDTGPMGTVTRDSRLEIGPSGEASRIAARLDVDKQQQTIHLGNEVTDATRVTGEQIEGIRRNTENSRIPDLAARQETVGTCETPAPWHEFMPVATAIKDPGLLLVLGLGALYTVAKDVFERLDKSDPEKSRTNEVKQLSHDYCDAMRELGKEHRAEREQLTESLKARHADPVTIDRQTAKQDDLHAGQIDDRQKEWHQKFSEMWQRHEKERTPYETEKAKAPDQVREKIDEWGRSGWPQYLQQREQQRER